MKNLDVTSPIKLITSGTVPTTADLSKGEIAFGEIAGVVKLFGSDGTQIIELGGYCDCDVIAQALNDINCRLEALEP